MRGQGYLSFVYIYYCLQSEEIKENQMGCLGCKLGRDSAFIDGTSDQDVH
jgi:hypothetical protein